MQRICYLQKTNNQIDLINLLKVCQWDSIEVAPRCHVVYERWSSLVIFRFETPTSHQGCPKFLAEILIYSSHDDFRRLDWLRCISRKKRFEINKFHQYYFRKSFNIVKKKMDRNGHPKRPIECSVAYGWNVPGTTIHYPDEMSLLKRTRAISVLGTSSDLVLSFIMVECLAAGL